MSVFNNDSAQVATLEDLVGDNKKYKSAEDLANAYGHADRTIAQRNQELAELREELGRRLAAEDILKQIRESQGSNTPAPTPPAPTKPEGNQPLSEEDLANRIRQVTQAERQQEVTRNNVDTVAVELVKTYGSEAKANEVVRQKAQELGVSVEFLQDVAAKSPKAFFTTIGINPQSNTPPPAAPKSNVNTQALADLSNVKEGTYQYYEAIRKTDPKRYWDKRTQNQMMKDKFLKGDAFGN